MAKPYTEEMVRLAETFSWAVETVDLSPLLQAIQTAGHFPLCAIGSGGSLTSAYALTALHQRYTHNLASVATPLEVIGEPFGTTVTVWLLSAGGSNIDVVSAAKTLIEREPRQISILCGNGASRLAKLCLQHPYVDLLLYPTPVGKDGFLATNSLFGFTTLLIRAYATKFGSSTSWRETVNCLEPLLQVDAPETEKWKQDTTPLWTRPTTLVLHGPSTQVGAIDLESKFTEAALGQIQLADYRNFAHGRHNWLAKRSKSSAVLAFITDSDRTLAEHTLDLLPVNVPQARISIKGNTNAAILTSLLAALRITGWAGTNRGIDPGRPGVPKFGRKLYHMGLNRPKQDCRLPRLTPRESAAIARKAGVEPSKIAAPGGLAHWREALANFRKRLYRVNFAGIVLDYDGTVVDTRQRFSPPETVMVTELVRLIESGCQIAFATGRGKSVRHDLQASLPHTIWPDILVGYYNGAQVAPLDDNFAPDGSTVVCDELQSLSEALRLHPELSISACQEDRLSQISLCPYHIMPIGRLWDLVYDVIQMVGANDVKVIRSGHSIDVVTASVSKLNVVQRLRERIGKSPILVIGDRGRWPGNDHELLSEPYSLGVDEINLDPVTCWHLGKPGQRGPTVTLEYLSALKPYKGSVKLETGSFR